MDADQILYLITVDWWNTAHDIIDEKERIYKPFISNRESYTKIVLEGRHETMRPGRDYLNHP